MLRIYQRKLEVSIRKNKSKDNTCVVYQHIGYQRNPDIKNKLIVDEKVKDIVEKIFMMYANGHGSTEIVNYLNSNKYLSPTGYRKTGIVQNENTNLTQICNESLKHETSKFCNIQNQKYYNWNEVTLCNMLKNEVYIGNTIQNKKTVVSYKVHKTKTVEKENQIRVNDTHEAIIDKDIFKKVQCILEKRGTNSKFKYNYLLRGMLYCYHCKRKLQIVRKKSSKKNVKAYAYITCSNHKKRGCYSLSMNYEKFEDEMINLVRKICRRYANKEVFYTIYEKYQNKTFDTTKKYQKEIEQIDKQIKNINNHLDKLYLDKLQGIVEEEDYVRISRKADI